MKNALEDLTDAFGSCRNLVFNGHPRAQNRVAWSGQPFGALSELRSLCGSDGGYECCGEKGVRTADEGPTSVFHSTAPPTHPRRLALLSPGCSVPAFACSQGARERRIIWPSDVLDCKSSTHRGSSSPSAPSQVLLWHPTERP